MARKNLYTLLAFVLTLGGYFVFKMFPHLLTSDTHVNRLVERYSFRNKVSRNLDSSNMSSSLQEPEQHTFIPFTSFLPNFANQVSRNYPMGNRSLSSLETVKSEIELKSKNQKASNAFNKSSCKYVLLILFEQSWNYEE